MAMNYEITPFFGTTLENGEIPLLDESDYGLTFFSPDNQMMGLSKSMLSKHILMLGGIGCGKTNTFFHIVDNLNGEMTQKDVMLLFDTKGDFYSRFYEEGDVVIGNSAAFEKETCYWNIFREIEYGGRTRQEKELTAREIARALFADRKNTSQPFFSSAACDLFRIAVTAKMREFWSMPEYAVLEHELSGYLESDLDRSAEIDMVQTEQRKLFARYADRYNNRVMMKEMFEKYTVKDYQQIFDLHEDFRSASTYIGNGESLQALGVFGELNNMLNDYFVGMFADYRPGRDISMRELIHEKNRRKIFVEYDLAIGEVLSPMYTLLIDLGLKEALGRSHSDGNVYLIIDEFKLLPKLRHIDDSLNFGRSLGIKVAAGIQNIRQLEDVYGETRGQVIAAGFSNIFAFRMTDEPSRKFVRELFGKNYLSMNYRDPTGEMKRLEREGNTVEDWQLMDLNVGQAVVGLAGHSPFLFQFEEFDT